jgi:peroxiredoxin
MTKRLPPRRAILLVLLVQSLLIAGYCSVERARRSASEIEFRYERLPERAAPDLLLQRADGSVRRLADLRGKPVLLHFWASWCWPCREELPGLVELGRELGESGELEVVALSLDTNWELVRTFFDGAVPPVVARESAETAAKAYEVSVLPDTYLIDARGNVRLRMGGPRDWSTRAAREALRAELKGAGQRRP